MEYLQVNLYLSYQAKTTFVLFMQILPYFITGRRLVGDFVCSSSLLTCFALTIFYTPFSHFVSYSFSNFFNWRPTKCFIWTSRMSIIIYPFYIFFFLFYISEIKQYACSDFTLPDPFLSWSSYTPSSRGLVLVYNY